MRRDELRELALVGVKQKIAELERLLASYREEFPELFLDGTPSMLLKAELSDKPPAAHWQQLARNGKPKHGSMTSRIVAYLQAHGPATPPEIGAGTGLTARNVHGNLTRMQQRGMIAHTSGRRGEYRAVEGPPAAPAAPTPAATPTRRRPIGEDPQSQVGRVLAFLRAHPAGSERTEIAAGLGIDVQRVSVICSDMRRKGIVTRTDKGWSVAPEAAAVGMHGNSWRFWKERWYTHLRELGKPEAAYESAAALGTTSKVILASSAKYLRAKIIRKVSGGRYAAGKPPDPAALAAAMAAYAASQQKEPAS